MRHPPTGAMCLIERYRERLPFAAGDPVVSLQEGSTPLVRAPGLSERVGAEVHLKLEGANPTGSFKDRGMTCAVSAAVREGAKAVICASTGNTAASAAAYAARARAARRGDRPRRQDRHGQARPGAHPRRARDRAARATSTRRSSSCASWPTRHPIALVNSVNEFRLEGQKTAAFELLEDLDGGARRALHPGRQRRQHHRLLARLSGDGRRAADVRLPGRGRRAARARAPRRAPGDGRERDPDRQPGALGGGDGRDDATRAARSARSPTRRSSPPTACWPPTEGIFCEPASAASVAGLLKYGADGAEQIVCVLTGHGLKDPQTAIAHNDGRIIELRGGDGRDRGGGAG